MSKMRLNIAVGAGIVVSGIITITLIMNILSLIGMINSYPSIANITIGVGFYMLIISLICFIIAYSLLYKNMNLRKCKKCGKMYSKNVFRRCVECGKETCPNCLDVELKICKDCKIEIDTKQMVEMRKFEDTRARVREEQKISVTKDILVFISYSSKDTDRFNIKKIAESLVSDDKIKRVFYYEGESYNDFIKYMNDNLAKCHVVLVFCSPNAIESEMVEKEWRTAEVLRKQIIPVFTKKEYIPPILRSYSGVLIDLFDIDKSIEEINTLIQRKLKYEEAY